MCELMASTQGPELGVLGWAIFPILLWNMRGDQHLSLGMA